MRIVGGRLRGLTLAAPSDDRVRPTSDRVRESIFNVLMHNDFDCGFAVEGARVLDLFAGTGALGLEALSRGATFVMFVDDHFESRGLIRRNVEAAHATGATKIWRRDAGMLTEIPANAGGAFNLVFMDPPYRKGLVALALQGAFGGGWLSPRAIIVAEMSKGEVCNIPEWADQHDERVYGDTRVVILSRRA